MLTGCVACALPVPGLAACALAAQAGPQVWAIELVCVWRCFEESLCVLC